MSARTLVILVAAAILCIHGAARAHDPAAAAADSSATALTLSDTELTEPLVFVMYGDMRFTSEQEHVASNPGARRALVARVAGEHPQALVLMGDVAWHGGDAGDYAVFRTETAPWRSQHLRVYPVLGNHEFQRCTEAQCLENWWQAFPAVRGRRWYSVALGSRVQLVALDSDASLLPGSAQRRWLDLTLAALPAQVRFVVIAIHHPPVADESWWIVRANESTLETLLRSTAARSAARFVVCSAHVHNYERFERDGVLYLVSGGGGAKPLSVLRSAEDRYHGGFPNYHYLRFELRGSRLQGQAVRLDDYGAPRPHAFRVVDRFAVDAKAP